MITYKSTNGMSSPQKHLKSNHQQLQAKWNEQKKVGLEIVGFKERCFANKRFGPIPNIIYVFFGSCVSYNKHGHCKEQFEENLVLFIIKELVPLSFDEVLFFRRLV